MSQFIIQGKKPLVGEIRVAGAKNLALKLFPAALLTDDEVILKNVPDILDVEVMASILTDLGAVVERDNAHTFTISCKDVQKNSISDEFVKKIRASFLFIVPLLARFGEVDFCLPGGDAIGRRPIDMTIENLRFMGVQIEEQVDRYRFKLKAKKFQAADIVFRWVSHTGTETMIMAAVLAEGISTIYNAALEPEVVALCEFLNRCGAHISGIGSPTLTIEGVDKLSGGAVTVIPDRLEAGTFACLGAITKSAITITHCEPRHLDVVWRTLQIAGVEFELGKDFVRVLPNARELKSVNLKTHEYPGFSTDLQAPFTVLMTQARGLSLIHETIYEGRLFYTDILNKMGANIIMADPHRVIVTGPTPLYGQKIESPDIRAGIALVLAALSAEGESVIDHIYHIDRGYENIIDRLSALGAQIKRIEK